MPGYNHYDTCTCGWCLKNGRSGHSSAASARLPDSTKRFLVSEGVITSFTACFVRPNATCPVCGARVFFYANNVGSRVFFDELGWPWPKHPCTERWSVRAPQPDDKFPPLGIRARGIRVEIREALESAGFSPLAKFVTDHGCNPPPLFKIIAVSRDGFLNMLELQPISLEADTATYIEFTSAKLIPVPGGFINFQDGKVSLLDWNLVPSSFQARTIDKRQFEMSVAGVRD